MAGPNRIPINPARLDFGPPAPLDGVVEANHDRSRRHEGSNEEQQKAVRDGAGGPAPCAEHPVVDGEPRPWSRPMTRSAAVTVRRPGASRDPAIRTRTWRQTAGVKEAAKGCIHAASTAGTLVGMAQAFL